MKFISHWKTRTEIEIDDSKRRAKENVFLLLRWPQQGDRPHEAQVEKAVVEEIGGRVSKVEKKYFNSKPDIDKKTFRALSVSGPSYIPLVKLWRNQIVKKDSFCIATE